MKSAALALMLSGLWISPAVAQYLVHSEESKSSVVETLNGAEIDWGAECYYASGEGVLPSIAEEPNRDKAYQKAKGYGRMKAVANLLAAIGMTPVTSNSVGKDYLDKDSQLQKTVEDSAANAQIVEDRMRTAGGDTVVVVTVKAPMYGANGPASAILRARFSRDTGPAENGVRVEKRRGSVSSRPPSDVKPPFTSLIVDCSGLDVERSMSPKIRRPDGSEIWGTLKVDYDFLQDRGIVAYARSTSEARQNERAGSNPLTVKAVGRAGGKFMCDAVISEADAEMVLNENRSSHFLDEFDVIFVVDGG